MVAVVHHSAGFEGLCTETTLGYGSQNWPISTGSTQKPIQNGNAIAVAKDLVKENSLLKKKPQWLVLVKTIEWLIAVMRNCSFLQFADEIPCNCLLYSYDLSACISA